MTIIPSKNKVICKSIGKEVTVGGFIIPEQDEKNKPEIAEVMAIGKGVAPVSMKVGDKIIYAKYMETKVQLDNGIKVVCVDFKDIFGVIDYAKSEK